MPPGVCWGNKMLCQVEAVKEMQKLRSRVAGGSVNMNVEVTKYYNIS